MLQVLDPDSSKIIEVLNTDPSGVRLTQAEVLYIDYLVSNAKAIGVWDSCKAFYGFVGGNAWKHKWNWKDMRDLNAAFRITWNGTVTHNNLGITGAGGYGNTFIYPNPNLNNISNHICCYVSRNNNNDQAYIGVSQSSPQRSVQLGYFSQQNVYGYTSIEFISTNNIGSSLIGIRDSNQQKIIINGSINTQTTPFVSNAISLYSIYLLGRNSNSGLQLPSTGNIKICTIGDGLTDQQAINWSHHVTVAQSILNRA